MSEFTFPGFSRSVMLCRDAMPRARRMAVYVRNRLGAIRQPKLSVAVAKYWYLGSVLPERTYVFSLYRKPDLSDLTSLRSRWATAPSPALKAELKNTMEYPETLLKINFYRNSLVNIEKKFIQNIISHSRFGIRRS